MSDAVEDNGPDAVRLRARRSVTWRLFAIIIGLSVLMTGMILYMNGGFFTYLLDDPYIHLAMAEEFLHGHYGINAGESAAAASSIAYPFLLALPLALGFGQFSALLINLMAALAAATIAVRICEDAELPLERLPLLTPVLAVAVLSLGLVVLVFTGLEHSLQLACTLVCIWGLWRYLDRGYVPPWWVAALIAAPLIRYESTSLLLAGTIVLLLRREWKWAVLAFFCGAGAVAGFSFFLLHLGLPPLPSSVLVKSQTMGGAEYGLAGLLRGIADAVMRNVFNVQSVPLLLGFVLTGLPVLGAVRRSWRPSHWNNEAYVGLFCGLVIAAHLLLGRHVWNGRYEAYAVVLAVFGSLLIYRARVAAWLAHAGGRAVVYAAACFCLLFIYNVALFAAAPRAASNVYEQQYQMHRFITEVYRGPVAVNDLGWTSYRNPYYVLDLWGLGSETARRLHRAHPTDASWMQRLAERHGVKLVMIFREWFPYLPCSWTQLGELHLSGRNVSVPVDHVTFFAAPPGDPEAIRARIKRFTSTLPEGVRFSFDEPGARPPGCRG